MPSNIVDFKTTPAGHAPSGIFDHLFADGTPSAEEIGAFLVEQTFPVAEPGWSTFAWHGEADKVELLRWINAGVDRKKLERIDGTNLWVLRIEVENGGRFEYKMCITRDGHEEWVLDPLNPATAGDPFGMNSVCQTWGYERPEWTRKSDAPEGEIKPLVVESATFGETRLEKVYLPANYDKDRPYPVVIVHDGSDYDEYADLGVSLDNLIAAGDIPPLIAVLIQTPDRMEEYPRGRRHARYVIDDLLPTIETEYPISDRPRDRILMGASLGAVASLSTAFRAPGTFGGLILKSGSFVLDQRKLASRPHPVFFRTARLSRAIERSGNLPGTRAFVSTGELEGLASENRALASLLRERGVDVLFKSAWDGHHWHNWRDQLRDALMWVLRDDETA